MSDLFFSMAKNSELIFTRKGKHLCSCVHPTREAHQWVSHHQSRWNNSESVIVLGLGCGYHVRALKAAASAAIYVLEPDPEVIKGALRIHPLDLQESQIFKLDAPDSARNFPALAAATGRSYCLLLHEPSAFAHASLFFPRRNAFSSAATKRAWRGFFKTAAFISRRTLTWSQARNLA